MIPFRVNNMPKEEKLSNPNKKNETKQNNDKEEEEIPYDEDELMNTMTAIIGEPLLSQWISSNVWIPLHQKLYTIDEMKRLFAHEKTLFVGDSLQRRAADTLCAAFLSSTPHDIRPEAFSKLACFTKENKDLGYEEKTVSFGTNASILLGFDWRPRLEAGKDDDDITHLEAFLKEYLLKKERYDKYTILVVSSTVWDVHLSPRRHTTAEDLQQRMAEIVTLFRQIIPSRVWVIFKTAGYCGPCPWKLEQPKRTVVENYKIHAINQQLLNSTKGVNNFLVIDWAREVLPRSIGKYRILGEDDNPYHYGFEARFQFLQFLTHALDERKPWILNPIATTNDNIIASNNHSSSSSSHPIIGMNVTTARIISDVLLPANKEYGKAMLVPSTSVALLVIILFLFSKNQTRIRSITRPSIIPIT